MALTNQNRLCLEELGSEGHPAGQGINLLVAGFGGGLGEGARPLGLSEGSLTISGKWGIETNFFF